jgi:transcriptional regulator with XRE-family HTH domain
LNWRCSTRQTLTRARGEFMNTLRALWRKLAASKKYREEFVAAQVKRGIPFQIQTLMKHKDFSQERLAKQSGLTQGVISRAANPDYGNLTLNTIIKIAGGFDVAFVGKFVPFSELGNWFANLSEEAVRVKSFEEENKEIAQALGLGRAEDALDTLQKPSGREPDLGSVFDIDKWKGGVAAD